MAKTVGVHGRWVVEKGVVTEILSAEVEPIECKHNTPRAEIVVVCSSCGDVLDQVPLVSGKLKEGQISVERCCECEGEAANSAVRDAEERANCGD